MRFKFFALLLIFVAGSCTIASAVFAISDPLAEQWAYEDIGLYSAWKKATGSQKVVVAVIDNGFDTFHSDLYDNAWQNLDEIPDNRIDDDNNGYIDDVWGWSFVPEDTNQNGKIDTNEELGTNDPRPRTENLSSEAIAAGIVHHGTVVAGLIGAVGGNGRGTSGVAQHVKLMNIRVVDETGEGSFSLLDTAIYYAVDNGADVINMSLVGPVNSDVQDAINYAYDHGVVVVAAAGNNSQDLNSSPMDPVCADAREPHQKILGVSSINSDHQLSGFSNRGSNCIDITAPGDGVTSTVRFSPTNGLNDKYLGGWQGTSFAAPLVSGAAALIKSIQPLWGPEDIYTALLSTVHHTAGQDETIYSNLFGAGLLQVDKAVDFALSKVASTVSTGSHKLQVVSAQTGNMQEFLSHDISTDRVVALKGIDSISSVYAPTWSGYVTAAYYSASERQITLYNDDWTIKARFRVPALGAVQVVASQDRVFVAPQYGTTTLFRQYGFDGTEHSLKSLGAAQDHGVSLALGSDATLYTFSQEAGVLHVRAWNAPYTTLSREFSPSSLDSQGSIAVGDIDGDGADEVILGPADGKAPMMSYYEADGGLKRTFAAYDGYAGGFTLLAYDYDGDGKADIVTVPKTSGDVVRIWTDKSRKLVSWVSFGGSTFVGQYAVK